MFAQDEIDAVIDGARQAVDDLAQDVDGLAGVADRMTGSPSADESAQGPSRQSAERSPRSEEQTLPPGVRRILGIRVPLIVRLADRTMPVSEVTRIAPGTIIEFYKPVDGEIDLLVNNHSIGSGVAVKVNEHYGIQLNRIGSLRQRIDSFVGR